jgi:transposase
VKVKGSKISLVVDEAGLPVDLRLDSANRHDLYACGKLVEKCPKGSFIVADRGYDASWFRRKLWKKGLKPRIPKRKKNNKKYDPIARLGRWRVERCFAWLGRFRKLEIRYEYYATHYKAFCYLACARLLLDKLTG